MWVVLLHGRVGACEERAVNSLRTRQLCAFDSAAHSVHFMRLSRGLCSYRTALECSLVWQCRKRSSLMDFEKAYFAAMVCAGRRARMSVLCSLETVLHRGGLVNALHPSIFDLTRGLPPFPLVRLHFHLQHHHPTALNTTTPLSTTLHNGLSIRHARCANIFPPVRLEPPQPRPAPFAIDRTALPRSGHQCPGCQRCRRSATGLRKTMELTRGPQDRPLLGTHHEGTAHPQQNPEALNRSNAHSSGVSSSPVPPTLPVQPRTSPSRKTPR